MGDTWDQDIDRRLNVTQQSIDADKLARADAEIAAQRDSLREHMGMVRERDAEIAALRELLTEARDCVASDINYTLAQSHHKPAAVDYLRALLLRVDSALNMPAEP